MSNPPKSLLKSRENLQAICKNPDRKGNPTINHNPMIKYEIFDKILSIIWGNIRKQISYNPPQFKYIIKLHEPQYNTYGFVYTEEIVLELIEILKKEYPGVDFTYKATAGYDGKIIETIIIMDWS